MAEGPATEDILLKTEKLINNLLLFIYQVFHTPVGFIFRPQKFQRYVGAILYPKTHARSLTQYAPPTSYLLVCTAICSFYGYWTSRSPVGAKLLLSSLLFAPFKSALDAVWKTYKDMKFGDIVYMMMPMIVIAVFFSFSNLFCSRILKIRARFKTFFLINAYTTGTYLLLHGLLFSYVVLLAGLQNRVANSTLSIFLLIMHIIIGLLILLVFYRYIQLFKRNLNIGNLQCAGLIFGSSIIFTLFFVPVLLLLFPVFAEVWK